MGEERCRGPGRGHLARLEHDRVTEEPGSLLLPGFHVAPTMDSVPARVFGVPRDFAEFELRFTWVADEREH